ncbi:MAG: hypothetical protein JW809_01455 [Pirellulales bacterium]|nr:hypothetical protein [Pirellulales bacterium]
MIALSSLLLGASASTAAPADPLGQTPSWNPPTAAAVRDRAMQWLAQHKVDEAIQTKAQREIWDGADDAPADAQTLARLAATFALADPRAEKLVRLCAQTRLPPELPGQEWLQDAATPPLEAANLRLLYGRWLAHQSLFDEAAAALADLEPGDVVDPASLLFYQAVVHHQLLDRDAGLEAIDRLLEGAEHCPRRYVALAHLLRDDLKDLTEDSLDHIARRMGDIERRLGLGRAGEPVLRIEDGVIESLDKLIKKLEEQLQQQQCNAGANNIQSTKPASDSQLMGGTGPGQVTQRRLANQHGWGNLPPKQREEALQQIGRHFPSHYQDVIEQYFRRLAEEE